MMIGTPVTCWFRLRRFGINHFSAKGDGDSQGPMPSNVVLPAADLAQSAAQAK